jgi:8-oxo-dGTP pyrophosphatase MutT (NUDIX family)
MDTTTDIFVKGEVVRVLIAVKATRELLLVKSYDRHIVWELPGGKVKKDELPLAAAIRELAEETGLSGITLTPKLAFDKAIPHDPSVVWRHHIFAGVCAVRPPIRIDNDEIIDYRFATLADIQAEDGLESMSQYYIMRITPPQNRHHR